MKHAENSYTGLKQKLPVARKKSAASFSKGSSQVSSIVARDDIARVIDRLPEESETPVLRAETFGISCRRQVVFSTNTIWHRTFCKA